MFTLQQIKNAQSKVKTGAEFPQFIQDIIKLGVRSYETFVSDIHTIYKGDNDFIVGSEPRFERAEISDACNKEAFASDLKDHQQGKTDFISFRNSCVKYGVDRWIVDTGKLTCTYFDKKGNVVLSEKIPAV